MGNMGNMSSSSEGEVVVKEGPSLSISSVGEREDGTKGNRRGKGKGIRNQMENQMGIRWESVYVIEYECY